MFRTAEPSPRPTKVFFQLVLLLVAFCLGIHFLLQDTSLIRSQDAASQSCSTAELASEEMQHLDDLGLAARSPEPIQLNRPPAVVARIIHLERQAAFPIRVPPKIA